MYIFSMSLSKKKQNKNQKKPQKNQISTQHKCIGYLSCFQNSIKVYNF